MNDRRPALLLLVAPALAMVLMLFVYPLGMSLVSAFTAHDGQPSLENFAKAFELYGYCLMGAKGVSPEWHLNFRKSLCG